MDAESMLITMKMVIKCADLGHPAKQWYAVRCLIEDVNSVLQAAR